MTLWNVEYETALDAWQADETPAFERVVAVWVWVLRFIDFGPPDSHDSVPGEEDVYISRIPEAGIFATYLALGYERRAVIRKFGS